MLYSLPYKFEHPGSMVKTGSANCLYVQKICNENISRHLSSILIGGTARCLDGEGECWANIRALGHDIH